MTNQRLPVPNEHRVPVVNALIIVTNVLIFFLGWKPMLSESWGAAGILTYAFGHHNEVHLISNMWFLLVFGTPVNQRVGNVYYFFAYFGCALFVGVCGWLVGPQGLLGASGALFGIMAMCAMLCAGQQITIFYFTLFPFSIVSSLVSRPRTFVDWFIRWDYFQTRVFFWCIIFVPFLQLLHLLWWRSNGLWHWTYLGHLLGFFCGIVAVVLLPRRVTIRGEMAGVASI